MVKKCTFVSEEIACADSKHHLPWHSCISADVTAINEVSGENLDLTLLFLSVIPLISSNALKTVVAKQG